MHVPLYPNCSQIQNPFPNPKETLNLDYNLDRHTKFSRYATVLHENHARMHPSSMACVEIDPQLVCVTMRMDATPFIVSE
jgi:hypothetical protein